MGADQLASLVRKGSNNSLSISVRADGGSYGGESAFGEAVCRAEERLTLETMIRKGKSLAQRLLKARILLNADVSEDGEGWSDSRIIEPLETSVSMVYRAMKAHAPSGARPILRIARQDTGGTLTEQLESKLLI